MPVKGKRMDQCSPLDRISDLVPVPPEKVKQFEDRLRTAMAKHDTPEERRARNEAVQRMRNVILD